jgi:hypothetical protein
MDVIAHPAFIHWNKSHKVRPNPKLKSSSGDVSVGCSQGYTVSQFQSESGKTGYETDSSSYTWVANEISNVLAELIRLVGHQGPTIQEPYSSNMRSRK